MTNDELLDRWHEAEKIHARASHDERPDAMFAKMAAEQAAINRFGLGPHLQAYREKFGVGPGA